MQLAARGESGGGAGGSNGSGGERVPLLVSGSGYAVWKPKAEVFLGLKGLRESLLDFATEKQWLKVTARAAEWAAADKAELLSVLFGDDTEEEGDDDDGGSSDAESSNSSQATRAPAAALAPRVSLQGTLKDKEADMRKQAAAMIKRSEMAYGHIFSALPNDVALMVKVVPQGWAHGLWKWLERKFQSTASDNVNVLLQEWHSLRQAESPKLESFDLYRARVDDLYMRLTAAKEQPTPRAYAYAMVNSLLPQYDVVVMALETGMLLNVRDYTKIRWDDVARIINMHERKIEAQTRKDAETASAKAMAVQHFHRKQWQSGSGGAQGAAPRGGQSEERRRCYRCGQVGHLKAACTSDVKSGTAAVPADHVAAAQTMSAGSADQQSKRKGHVSAAVGARADAAQVQATAAGARNASAVSFAAVDQAAGTAMTVGAAVMADRAQKRIGMDSMASINVSSDIDMLLDLKPC